MATYWLPGYLVLESEALSIIRAFCEAFADCSLWSGLNRDWILLGSRGGIAPVSRAHFSRLWRLERAGSELRRLGIDGPAQLAGQFMADADALRELSAQALPLVDDHPRRIGPALFAEPLRRYAWLMDAARGRERLETSPWAGILPAAVVAESRAAFRRRAILDAAFFPELRPADYNYWRDVAELIRDSELVELPRWLLQSGAQAAQIAARSDPADPVAAEHRAVDALASRRRPASGLDRDRFAALTPWGQHVTLFHHCLAGEATRARTLAGWMRTQGREPDPALLAWAAADCGQFGAKQ
jgi:hypothetical protein